MSEFTGGKWVTDDSGKYVFTKMPEDLMMVAQMRGWSYLTGVLNLSAKEAIKVQKANARLIAAAPEMYELLKVWTNIQAQPTLMNARKRAQELLELIDETEASDG